MIATSVVCGLAQPTLADGMAFKGRDTSAMLPIIEHEQVAAITHDGTRERLVIAVDIGDALTVDENALWIFPVRGAPEDVTVDLVDTFPAPRGRDVYASAAEGVAGLFTLTRATQAYPMLLEMCLLMPLGRSSRRVTVSEEVERYGLRAALVTAESTEALGDWLAERQTPIEPAHLATFGPYLNADHTLVVVSIASAEMVAAEFPDAWRSPLLRGRRPCVAVEFPTDRPFYPMYPTSAYGDWPIRLRLYVNGHVQPVSTATVADDLRVGLCESSAQRPASVGHMPDVVEYRYYTAIQGRSAAESFTADLEFEPVESPQLSYAIVARRITRQGVLVVPLILVVGVLSYVSGGLAGLAVFGCWRKPARLGLWNLLTLLALMLVVHRRYKAGTLPSSGTPRGGDRPDTRFGLVFSIIFVVFTIIAQVLASAPLNV
ncbi:MAG: hypothetical protein KAS72_12470 [Phycisphaerales bacterium]|nr:hypothetical protein [Phycisphaerales bacterium]